MDELNKTVEAVAKRATETTNADEALKFTQAALNAAHAIATLKAAE